MQSLSAIQRPRLRAAALLEVVLSLGLLVLAMGIVGIVFKNGHDNVIMAEEMSRAMLLTDRLIAEFDTKILDEDMREYVGYFGEEAPAGMSFRVELNPSEQIPGMLEVDIGIFKGDPSGPEDQLDRILSTRVFRAQPMGIDFERDFGLDQEQIQQITDAIPGGAQVLDPTNFDPRALASLDLDTLIELLPTLVQAFGGQFGSGELDQIINAVRSGDVGQLQQIAGQRGGGGFAVPAPPGSEGDSQGAAPPPAASPSGRRPRGFAPQGEGEVGPDGQDQNPPRGNRPRRGGASGGRG